MKDNEGERIKDKGESTPHSSLPAPDGILPVTYISVSSSAPRDIAGSIVEEAQACISVNGKELANFMCSPSDLIQLAYGFLYNEGIINNLDDVDHIHESDGNCLDVWLTTEFTPPERLIVTAGCGGGVTFDDLSEEHDPLESDLSASPKQLANLMRQMHLGATRYQEARGIHTAALATPDKILLQVEDIGRHNCLDKLRGLALMQGIDSHNHILLSSGRISSEMANKARRLGTPIVCSRTSPTSLSVQLADAWGLTLVAYLRQDKMRLYTHPDRIIG